MASNPSLQRFIRRNIYAMKRQYGARIDLYRVVSSVTDHLTGEKTVVKEVHRIRRAPVLPYTMRRDVTQTISIISADKQFVYGGFYDAARREIIIDARDIPRDWEIRPEDYVVFEGSRWEVITIQKFEYDTGWVIAVKNLPNMPAYEIQDVLVTQDMSLAATAEGLLAPEQSQSVLSSLGLSDNLTVLRGLGDNSSNVSGLNLQQTVVAQVN
jgi:hypothetical protein